MSNPLNVTVLCEGQTEQKFIKEVLAPYLWSKEIYMTPIVISKKGEKGGDVKFQRVQNDIAASLRQPNVSIVTTFVDYYGLKEWPGKDTVPHNSTPPQIAEHLNNAAKEIICRTYGDLNPQNRFIPFMAVHEFEALLFSDSQVLGEALNIDRTDIDQVLSACGSPEHINNSPQTAPAKRLLSWTNQTYKKTTDGIAIAKEIGIDRMREKCPLFHAWLLHIEELQVQ